METGPSANELSAAAIKQNEEQRSRQIQVQQVAALQIIRARGAFQIAAALVDQYDSLEFLNELPDEKGEPIGEALYERLADTAVELADRVMFRTCGRLGSPEKDKEEADHEEPDEPAFPGYSSE